MSWPCIVNSVRPSDKRISANKFEPLRYSQCVVHWCEWKIKSELLVLFFRGGRTRKSRSPVSAFQDNTCQIWCIPAKNGKDLLISRNLAHFRAFKLELCLWTVEFGCLTFICHLYMPYRLSNQQLILTLQWGPGSNIIALRHRCDIGVLCISSQVKQHWNVTLRGTSHPASSSVM
jgi:hypothetical protein